MTELGPVLEQLKRERKQLDRAIAALSGITSRGTSNERHGVRRMSLAARRRIAAAQRARWAKAKASSTGQKVVAMPRKKRPMSAAARRRIAAAQRARWAKVRAKKAK